MKQLQRAEIRLSANKSWKRTAQQGLLLVLLLLCFLQFVTILQNNIVAEALCTES